MHHHILTTYTLFFFFNDTATTEIYTLSLHDALPILCVERLAQALPAPREVAEMEAVAVEQAPLVGDQVEIGAYAASAPPAAHQRRQPDRHRRLQFARTARRAGLPPRRHQHPCAQLRSLPTRRLREL